MDLGLELGLGLELELELELENASSATSQRRRADSLFECIPYKEGNTGLGLLKIDLQRVEGSGHLTRKDNGPNFLSRPHHFLFWTIFRVRARVRIRVSNLPPFD